MRYILSAFFLVAGVLASPAMAEDLRIHTKVYDVAKDTTKPVAQSLTVFHKGRVYDYIGSLNEVIVYEPKEDRFVVLNTSANIRVILTTADIEKLMQKVHTVVEEQIAELRKRGDLASNATANMLAFQMKPKFRSSYDASKKRLSLQSGFVKYEAKMVAVESRKTAAAYRKYADWIGRLNYVLYPRVLLPAARRELNAKIAERGMLPLEVTLTLDTRPAVHVRAEHRIGRKLDAKDRTHIRNWNAMLTSRSVRELSLQDYQRRQGLRRASR